MARNYCIATFCYGERYYEQTNRLIESFKGIKEVPEIFVVTDRPNFIDVVDGVFVKDIREYNEVYSVYSDNYYGFDFSVKRYSLRAAFDHGHTNVILADTDVVVNESLFSKASALSSFYANAISGQTTYTFSDEIKTNSELGKRFIKYEEVFGVSFDKQLLNEMPEDCIQFISMRKNVRYKFLDTWDACIKIKDENGLLNIPCGNIDEMCFSALYNGLEVKNNSNKSINLLIALHDKWY